MTFAFSVTQMSPAIAVSAIVLSAATTPLSEILTSVPAVPVRSPPAATFALLATTMSFAVAVTSILPDAATTPRFWTLTSFAARSVIWLSPLNVFSSTTVPAITVAVLPAAASLLTMMSPPCASIFSVSPEVTPLPFARTSAVLRTCTSCAAVIATVVSALTVASSFTTMELPAAVASIVTLPVSAFTRPFVSSS